MLNCDFHHHIPGRLCAMYKAMLGPLCFSRERGLEWWFGILLAWIAWLQGLNAGRHGCHSASRHGEEKQRLGICAMARGPPKQGRGYDSRKASIGGVRRRMSNKELDQDGWVQVIYRGAFVLEKMWTFSVVSMWINGIHCAGLFQLPLFPSRVGLNCLPLKNRFIRPIHDVMEFHSPPFKKCFSHEVIRVSPLVSVLYGMVFALS